MSLSPLATQNAAPHPMSLQDGLDELRLKRLSRVRAAAIIVLFLVFGAAWSLVVPPFETPDEPFHYGFARHIAQGNGLPVQSSEETGPWAQEGSQAPLYYLLTGWLTRWIDQDDFANIAVRNPRANIGDPLDPGNKNFMLYSGRQPPLAGSNLALHVGRWFSLLLGAITLACVYLTAELMQVGRRRPYGFALLATCLVAVIPQFLFISASFTNDTLVMAASAAAIYWLARLLVRPANLPVRPWEWIVLGVLLGVAALSKLQGLGLIPATGIVVLFLAWRRRSWRIIAEAVLLVGLPAVTLAGWWYVRNIQLYGDWSGLGHLTSINGARARPLDWEDFWPEFRGLRYSFWGLFGWFNILLPDWFYTLADVLTLAGMVGLVGALVRLARRSPRPLLDQPAIRVTGLLVLWAVLTFLLLIYWITQATGSQGRLIFPGIIAYGLLLTMGIDFWLQLLPRLARQVAWTALLLAMLGMALYSVAWLLPGIYNAPAPVAAIPGTAQPVNLTIGGSERLQLAAVEVGSGRYHPGERVPVTLYWRTEQPLAHDYQIFVQLLDDQGGEVANLTSHPGWGRNPTTFWQPDALYADPYQVLVSAPVDPRSPLLARVYTGVIDPQREEIDNLPLPARTAEGTEVTPFVATVELEAGRGVDLAEAGIPPAGAVFGGVIRLAGSAAGPGAVEAGETLTATLVWDALAQPQTDYTAYVHLLDANNQQVAGYDQAPAGNRFPTSHWRAGDRIVSDYVLPLPVDLPPGRYSLWTGLYETASAGALRLPVTDAAGFPAGDGQVQVTQVEITR